MNHPEAWPVEEIVIGRITYNRNDAIENMMPSVKDAKTFTMFPALVAAKLNVLIGYDDSCIINTISEADVWMAQFPLGSGVISRGEASQYSHGEQLYLALDAYNNRDATYVTSREALDYD